MKVKMIKFPTEEDWVEVKRRALITQYGKGLGDVKVPSSDWKHKILEARHSPIRYLQFGFLIQGIPYNVSVHLCRHVHSQPYVSSLRNDRQTIIDGDSARRDTPVNMILDVNAEELMVIAHKRLCNKASSKTHYVVSLMCLEAKKMVPELGGLLVPMCKYNGGICHEMYSCGLSPSSHNEVDTTHD